MIPKMLSVRPSEKVRSGIPRSYGVADNMDGCGSLHCNGGEVGPCERHVDKSFWLERLVQHGEASLPLLYITLPGNGKSGVENSSGGRRRGVAAVKVKQVRNSPVGEPLDR